VKKQRVHKIATMYRETLDKFEINKQFTAKDFVSKFKIMHKNEINTANPEKTVACWLAKETDVYKDRFGKKVMTFWRINDNVESLITDIKEELVVEKPFDYQHELIKQLTRIANVLEKSEILIQQAR